jgi:hypothetical protein
VAPPIRTQPSPEPAAEIAPEAAQDDSAETEVSVAEPAIAAPADLP